MGIIPGAELKRVGEAIGNTSSDVTVDVTFDMDGRRAVLRGKVQCDLELDCLRCLEPTTYYLEADVSLGVVSDESYIEQLEKGYEPWVVEEKSADLYSAIEDEVLLALPMVVYHDHECLPKSLYRVADPGAVEEAEKPSPFAVLGSLKDKSNEP